MKNIISIVVKNNSSVLARVSSLFGRRGFNIDSLSVSATDD
ncbi:MAG: acetolactate synthase small subunit, partial [Clostridia bacterium]|nr:acetolactate synthase small subunit [Clostridia bacterium]